MPQFRDNFHSEEAQEIMGRAPSWVVRWGITVIFVILALIVLGCYIIKYPQTVTAPISITTVNAPSDLTARYDGLLDSVCVGNGENVRTGQLIALLATPADYDDIRSLEEHLSATDSPQALAEVDGRPCRRGPLKLLSGPERIESGWWDSGEASGDIRRDYFIALSSDDEDNILSGLLSKRLGARRAIVLINRRAYTELVQGTQIDVAISPQHAATSARLRRKSQITLS